MPDYLTRLAERTLGLASVVQPRLVSRYASWVEMDNNNTFATPSTFALASHSVTASVGLVAVQASSDALDHPNPQLMRSGDPVVPHTRNDLLSGQMTSKHAASHSELDSEHTPPMSQIETLTLGSSDVHQLDAFHLKEPSSPRISDPVRSTAGLAKPTPLSNQDDPATSLVTPNGDAVQPTELRTTPPLHRPPSSVVPQSIEQPGHQPHAHAAYIPLVPASNELNNTTSQQTNLASALVRLEENSLPTSAVDPSFLNRVTSSTTQPVKNHERTIEIRIGRVEVRGIQTDTPTQQARSTPSTPSLSLSDYLNQRDGSNR